MKILVVAASFPWPVRSGNAMRTTNVVSGLSRLGDVELFALGDSRHLGAGPVCQDPGVTRVAIAGRPPASRSLGRRLGWFARPRLPLELDGRDYGPVRKSFTAWAEPAYDLVWFCRAESWMALRGIAHGPAIVDLDDLEDLKLRGRLATAGPGDTDRGLVRAVRPTLVRFQGERNADQWRALQHRAASSVKAVAVCSDLDAARVAVPNAVVVPNSYERPVQPLGRVAVGQPPTILLAGMLTYPPNADAARFFVREVAPGLRAQMPDVRVRLVGRLDERVRELHNPPAVICTGWVDDMADELARADLVVAPVRVGGGTRIKILEAFAHRIPVVSTTIGAEGLDVESRQHLLLADGADELAAACAELLTDAGLRQSLADHAHRLYLRRYQGTIVRDVIASVASRVAAGTGS